MTPDRRVCGRPGQPRPAEFGELVLVRRPQALIQADVGLRWDLAVCLGAQ